MSAFNKIVQGTFGFGSILFAAANIIFAIGWFGALIYSISLFRPSIANSYLWLLVPHGAAVMLFLNGTRVQPPEERQPTTTDSGRFAGYIRKFKIFWSPTLWSFGLFLISILCTLLMLILYAFIWVGCILGIGTLSSAGTQACADERWLVWLNPAFALVFALFALTGAALSLFQVYTINKLIQAVTGVLPSQMFASGGAGGEEDVSGEFEDVTTTGDTSGSFESNITPEYTAGSPYILPTGYYASVPAGYIPAGARGSGIPLYRGKGGSRGRGTS